jgi:VanZ family protein
LRNLRGCLDRQRNLDDRVQEGDFVMPRGAGARSRPTPAPPRSPPPPVARGWLLAYLAVLGLLTLSPAPVPTQTPPFFCLLCSDRGVSDALANVLLFLPLGLLLNWNGVSLRLGLGVALGVSGLIEGIQVMIPGRFPDVSDILTNGGGGALGVLLGRRPDRWVFPSSPWRPRLFMGALGAAVLAPGAVGLLLQPIEPAGRLWTQWTPRMPNLEPWQGTVRSVALDGQPLPHAVPLTPGHRSSVEGHRPLRLDVVAGPLTVGLSPLLRIVDDHGVEARLLAVRGDALVWMTRNRAQALLLDGTEIRWPGALQAVSPGEEAVVLVEPTPDGVCFRWADSSRCGLGHHAGRGWSFLHGARWLDDRTHALLDHLWIAGTLFLVGFWTPPAWRLAPWAGLLLPLLALVASGAMGTLVAVPLSALAAGAAGWGMGWAVGAGRTPLLRDRATDRATPAP